MTYEPKTMTTAELECVIQLHAKLYFVDNAPEITDAEFDALVAELRSRDPNNAVLKTVGSTPTYGQKVRHPSIMGSLDKASDKRALLDWWEKLGCPAVVASPKMDGAAIRLVYESGKLVLAATRGDGTEGQLCTDNARAINFLPKDLDYAWTGEVRGEIYMPRSVFKELNDQGAGLANPRNAAAGAIGQKDPAEVTKRGLHFACYGASMEGTANADLLNTVLPEKLANLCVHFCSPCKTESEIIAVVDYWTARRPALDYEIDGIVFSIHDRHALADAGMNGNCPRGKVAYKFPTEQVKTTVTEITWNVGRTGVVMPLATLAMVRIAGSNVSSATLHSLNKAKELGIAVGDQILLEKGGDIIPHIIRVTAKGTGTLNVPSVCPICGSTLLEEGANLWCVNPNCPARLEERVLFYLQTLGIKGIGPAFVNSICAAGMVKRLIDLYCLDPNDVTSIGVGNVIANKAVSAILDRHTVELPVFLDSLGIHSLGTSTSKFLAEEYRSLDAIFCVTVDQLSRFNGFGPVKATSIVNGLAVMRTEIEELASILTVTMPEKKTGGLTGSSFLITGALSKPRSVVEKEIEANGGKLESSVNKNLSYLIQADPASTSSKSVKAKKLGIKIISEAELYAMLA